jgi:hypothetical protein
MSPVQDRRFASLDAPEVIREQLGELVTRGSDEIRFV